MILYRIMEEIELHIDPLADEEQVAHLIEAAAARYGLQVHLQTTLRSYPGSQHWHLRKQGESGTLEITCWPKGKRAWIGVHTNRQGGWITEVLPGIKMWLEERLL
ncbi:MAG TPA: hypothetical protein VEU97_11155 [Ktedonobacteraceae bacterium]|nr:hypothetical protein [Ktedonobacteraceae bacterium]